ncbi:MAG: hypothetical protein PVG96_15170 [Desulfobacterales bacterium]|jgi:hypothetical protein
MQDLILEIRRISNFIFFPVDKQKTVLPVHNIAHFIDWISPAFKSHRAATMWEVRIPGDIIMGALVAINSHINHGVLEHWSIGELEDS